MKIKTISIQNFKNISDLKADLDGKGNVIYVTGHNGAGKSSVLEAIYMAIAKTTAPQEPVKKGESKAVINVVVGDKKTKIEIARSFSVKGGNKLTVKENGKVITNPRVLLDSLLSEVSIDPQKFLNMNDKEQVKLMAKACDIAYDFEGEEAKTKNDIEERKSLKREIERLKGSYNSIEIPDNIAGCGFDLVKLNKELQEVNEKNSEIKSLNDKRNNALARLEELKAEAGGLKEIIGFKIDGEIVDTNKILEKIETATKFLGIKSKVDMKETYKVTLISEDKKLKATQALIDARDVERNKAISEAKIPVKGLEIKEGSLVLNGNPFSQASTAERIEVASSLSVMSNKDIKIINIKDASLLDAEVLKRVSDVANKNDCQIFLEIVNNNENVELVFEETGEVAVEEVAVLEEVVNDTPAPSEPPKPEPEPEQEALDLSDFDVDDM